MLRLNGKPIWNIVDLKKDFSVTEIYGQRKEFFVFARVHCSVLSTRLVDNDSESYEASFLTKDFWCKILSFDEDITPDDSWLDYFVQKRIFEELGEKHSKSEEKSIREDIETELRDAFIREKLDYIIKNGNVKDTDVKAVIYLAICEIAEVDVREQIFEVAVAEDTEIHQKNNIQDIVFDEEKNILTVNASKTRYHLKVFEGKVLPENLKIRTVRIEAVASVNKYYNAVLEFCNKKGEIISSVTVRPGEYRYMNVVGDEVVGFLPSVSIENGCCVYRNGYGSRNVKIATNGSQPRTISKYEYECFVSAGKNAGALFIRNGKIVTDYCDFPLDYRTKLVFDMIVASLNVAEIACIGNTVKVLSNSGKVYSILSSDGDSCGWINVSLKSPEAENVVTLRENIRIGNEPKTEEDVLETAVSYDGAESASLLRSGECRINYR